MKVSNRWFLGLKNTMGINSFRNSPVFLQVTQLISLLVPLFTVPYYLKLYDLASFGHLSYLILVGGILNILVDFGQNQYGIIEISRIDLNKRLGVSQNVVGIQFVNTTLILALALIISAYTKELMFFLVLVSIFLGGLFPSWYFIALRRQNELALYRLLYSVIYLTSIALLLPLGDHFYVFSMGLSNLLLFLLVLYREDLWPRISLSVSHYKEFYICRLPFIFNRIVKNVYGQGYLFVSQIIVPNEVFGALIIYDKIITVYRRLLQPITLMGMAEVRYISRLPRVVLRFIWYPVVSVLAMIILGETVILAISSNQINLDLEIRLLLSGLFVLLYCNTFIGEISFITVERLKIYVGYMLVYSFFLNLSMLLIAESENMIYTIIISGELLSLVFFTVYYLHNVASNS